MQAGPFRGPATRGFKLNARTKLANRQAAITNAYMNETKFVVKSRFSGRCARSDRMPLAGSAETPNKSINLVDSRSLKTVEVRHRYGF